MPRIRNASASTTSSASSITTSSQPPLPVPAPSTTLPPIITSPTSSEPSNPPSSRSSASTDLFATLANYNDQLLWEQVLLSPQHALELERLFDDRNDIHSLLAINIFRSADALNQLVEEVSAETGAVRT